jgi:hypothetical protein
VSEGRSKTESNQAKVIPGFAPGVVQNDEEAARGNRMGEKIVGFAVDAVVSGDRVGIGVWA